MSKEPLEAHAWLDLIAINIVSCDWDEAIALYGQSEPYTKSKETQLFRSYLGCLALAFAGDPIEEEDVAPLYDQAIQLETLISRELRICAFVGRSNLGNLQQAKREKAVQIMKMLVGHYDDYGTRGDMFYKLELYDEALVAFDKAIEVAPDDVLAWNGKGEVLQTLGRVEEAIAVFEKALDIQST